jgi:CBS-domain-containing membrane protein
MPTVFELSNPFSPAISADALLSSALEIFDKCSLSTLPITQKGIFCGTLEKRDLEHATIRKNSLVKEFLNRNTIFLNPNDSAQNAADLLSIGILDIIPVVTNAGYLLGIVTTADLPLGMRNNVSSKMA